jgi:hypothetical protein
MKLTITGWFFVALLCGLPAKEQEILDASVQMLQEKEPKA